MTKSTPLTKDMKARMLQYLSKALKDGPLFKLADKAQEEFTDAVEKHIKSCFTPSDWKMLDRLGYLRKQVQSNSGYMKDSWGCTLSREILIPELPCRRENIIKATPEVEAIAVKSKKAASTASEWKGKSYNVIARMVGDSRTLESLLLVWPEAQIAFNYIEPPVEVAEMAVIKLESQARLAKFNKK